MKKTVALFLSVIMLVLPMSASFVSASAEDERKCIVSGYPRLYFTPDEKEALLTRAADEEIGYNGKSGKQIADSIIAEAEAYVESGKFSCSYYNDYVLEFELPMEDPSNRRELLSPPPGYSGDYPYWTLMSRAIESRLKALALAYYITGNTDFSSKAIEYAMSVCGWSQWSDPNYGGSTCLDTAHLTYGVTTVYDMVYDVMTEEERSFMKEAIIEKSIEPLSRAAKAKLDTNVQVLKVSAFTAAVCLLYEDLGDDVNEYLDTIDEYFTWYLNYLNTSGNHEGLMYATYCIEYMVIAFDNLNRVCGISGYLDHEYLNDFLMDWLVAGSENTRCMTYNIGDSWTSGGFDVTASVLNKVNKNPAAGYFLSKSGRGAAGFDGFIYRVDDPVIERPDYLQSVYLDRVGWGSMRTGWEASDSVFVFTSSRSNMYHNHYDNNSFMIAVNGSFIANDAGYQDYGQGPNQQYTLLDGHSTLYVDGKSQFKKGTGSITEKLTTPFMTFMTGHAAESFVTNQGMNKFDRSFLLINHAENPYYIVLDDISSEKNHIYTWRLNVSETENCEVEGSPAGLGQTVKGKNAVVSNDRATLGISFADTGDLNMKYYKYADSLGTLLDVGSDSNRPDARFMAVLTPSAAGNMRFLLNYYADKAVLSDDGIELSQSKADAEGMLLFKPKSEGDYVEIPLECGRTGKYDLTFTLAKANLYGTATFSMNGTELGSFDGYIDDYLDLDEVKFKGVEMNKGENILRVTCGGSSNENAETMFTGLVSLECEPCDGSSSMAKVTKTVNEDGILGGEISYGTDGGKKDLILFAFDSKGIDKEGLSTDGIEASVFGLTEGGFDDGYSATYAKNLSYNGVTLIECETPVTAAISFSSPGSAIVSYADTTAKIYVPSADKKLFVNGKEIEIEKGDDARLVEVTLLAGENSVEFVDASGGISLQTIIILICAAVSLLAIAVCIIVLKKDRNTK